MTNLHKPANLLSHSPPLHISHDRNNTTSHDPLPLFSHITLPKGGVAFIGGPVSALSFHPSAPGICLTAAHNKTNPTHILHKCYEGPAIIQLWHFSLSNKSPETKCLGLIPHNGDCTFDLKWRPNNSRNISSNWSGTFAAALGDGSVIVCHLDAEDIPTIDDRTEGNAPSLEPTTIVLRRNNARSPVRVVEWSPDGKRLVVGSANGNVEVYEADSHDACWPSWTIPAQESVISDIRWLSPKLYCTLGMSSVLRLCDVRDPIATLEQNYEGIQGGLSMAMLEPNVAAVGADSGYLRVVRLSAIDQVTAPNPVRKVYLQTSSFRDMRSASFSDRTVLYTGGSEGILHQAVFPKPLWPLQGACQIGNTGISVRLRWNLDGNLMHLRLNPPQPKEKGKKKSGAAGRGMSGVFCGERYKQPIVVTRIAVSAQNNVIAVGIDGGFVTWLPINTSGSHATPVVEEDEHMFSTTHLSLNGENQQSEELNGDVVGCDFSPSLKNIPFKVKLKKEAKRPVFGPKRKRGRPRKIVVDDLLNTEKPEEQTEDKTGVNPDTVDVPKSTTKRGRSSRKEKEPPTPIARPRRTGKRGRPRKHPDTSAIRPPEIVEDQAIDGKRKLRKRRRTHASNSSAQSEPMTQAEDTQADVVHGGTAPPQDKEADDGMISNPRDTTSPAKALGPSTKRTEARSNQREQQARLGMSIPLCLQIRKPILENMDSGMKLTGEPAQSGRVNARRSELSAEAPAWELAVEPGVAVHSQAPATSSISREEIAADPPPPKLKPDISKQAPAVGRRVKLVIREKAPATSPSAEADVGTTSGINEGSTSIPVYLRIRKRRAAEISELADEREQTPKRSRTDPPVMDDGMPAGPIAESRRRPKHVITTPQVMDEATYSSDVVEGGMETLETAGHAPIVAPIARPIAAPIRSTRVRKPSWRVRGD